MHRHSCAIRSLLPNRNVPVQSHNFLVSYHSILTSNSPARFWTLPSLFLTFRLVHTLLLSPPPSTTHQPTHSPIKTSPSSTLPTPISLFPTPNSSVCAISAVINMTLKLIPNIWPVTSSFEDIPSTASTNLLIENVLCPVPLLSLSLHLPRHVPSPDSPLVPPQSLQCTILRAFRRLLSTMTHLPQRSPFPPSNEPITYMTFWSTVFFLNPPPNLVHSLAPTHAAALSPTSQTPPSSQAPIIVLIILMTSPLVLLAMSSIAFSPALSALLRTSVKRDAAWLTGSWSKFWTLDSVITARSHATVQPVISSNKLQKLLILYLLIDLWWKWIPYEWSLYKTT